MANSDREIYPTADDRLKNQIKALSKRLLLVRWCAKLVPCRLELVKEMKLLKQ